jgi:hypothetical protein
MSRLTDHLAQTDLRIAELTQQIDLHRNRLARKSNDPVSPEQARQLLPAMSAELEELARYRIRLLHAVEVEALLAPRDDTVPRRHCIVPRYMR